MYGDQTIILARDVLQYIFNTFSIVLEKSLKNELLLDTSFIVGKVGYFFSQKTYMNTNTLEEKDDIFAKYWVWSSSDNIQTWLYNIDNKIYLEISLTYPWLFSDPKENELYTSFDEYMKNYRPIVVVELQRSLVQEWINQCQDILQKMKKIQ